MQFKQNVDDRRNGIRFTFSVNVTIFVEGKEVALEAMSKNVSVTGLALDCDIAEQYIGKECELKVTFPGQHSQLIIQSLGGVIIRSDDDGTAINFLQPLEWFLLFPVYQGKMNQVMQQSAESS